MADPFLRCAFLNPYAIALALNANYDDALRVAERAHPRRDRSQLELMLPSGYTARGLALAGLREFEGAHALLTRRYERAKRCMDNYAHQNAYACRMRVLAQERRFSEACTIEPPPLDGALPSMRGEVGASRRSRFGMLRKILGGEASARLAIEVTRRA